MGFLHFHFNVCKKKAAPSVLGESGKCYSGLYRFKVHREIVEGFVWQVIFRRRVLMVFVQFVRFHLEFAQDEFPDVESVLRVGVGQVAVVLVLCNVEFLGQERPDAAQLQDALHPVHHGDFVD